MKKNQRQLRLFKITPPMTGPRIGAIRLPADQARPQSIEPPSNRATESIHIRLPPKRSTAQPVSGITMAIASR
jgi:hypothetical protein